MRIVVEKMSNFSSLMRRADTIRRFETDPLIETWWAGYMRGLRRAHHGETFGTLNLTGSSVLNLLDDATDADLTFASFGSLIGGSILTVNGWNGGSFLSQSPGGTRDRLFIGGLLSQQQLDAILFAGGPTVSGKAYQLPSGEIIPVPEPSTWALLGASLAAIPFMRRKRA